VCCQLLWSTSISLGVNKLKVTEEGKAVKCKEYSTISSVSVIQCWNLS